MAGFRSVAGSLVSWWFHPGCPLCRRRTEDIEAHLRHEHAELPGLSGAR